MNNIKSFKLLFLIIFSTIFFTKSGYSANKPLVIKEQGSFAVGGSVIQESGTFDPIKQGAYNPNGPNSEGQTLHGDHAYVFYQIPVNTRKYPLVFWHGHGQSSKTWETTPDGREGFQNIFLHRQFSVYVLDQPGRGKASRRTESLNLVSAPDEQLWFGIFRIGIWPNLYKDVQFSSDPEALNQFFRQMVPNTAPYNVDINVKAVSSLFDKIGSSILVTHSQSGTLGWRTAIKNSNVKAIVSYEPGGDFLFPEGESPNIPFGKGSFKPPVISISDFMKLTKIPIIIYYGDNIPDKPSLKPGEEQWRIFLDVASKWKEVVNKYGGDVTLVHLPKIGIKGNTHFPMSDLNNIEIADLMSDFLKSKKLD